MLACLACLDCCGLRVSRLLEVRNCRLWPLLPGAGRAAAEDGSGERGDQGDAPAQNSCLFDVDWCQQHVSESANSNIPGIAVAFTGQSIRIHQEGQGWPMSEFDNRA